MIGLNDDLVILIVGLAYLVVLGGLSLLRREGPSSQFIVEVLAVTFLIALGGYLTGSPANPIFFLILLYMLTMRSRLLVDVATILSNRGRQRDALETLQIALRLLPDKPARLIALVNMGMVQLRRQSPGSAEEILTSVLEEAKRGGLGSQYTAACHYNLGLAFQRQNKDAKAVEHFMAASDCMPGSLYSKAAREALEQRRLRSTRKTNASKSAGKASHPR